MTSVSPWFWHWFFDLWPSRTEKWWLEEYWTLEKGPVPFQGAFLKLQGCVTLIIYMSYWFGLWWNNINQCFKLMVCGGDLFFFTLPKTNIAHENPPFWWYLPGKMGFSWAMLVSGRVKLKNSLIADSSSIYIITPSWVPQYFTSSSRRGVDVCIFAGNRFFEFPDGNWTQKFSC